MDWREAHFKQARSDYELLQVLMRENAAFCHQLHYLQMATEKLAKGFSTSPGGPQPLKVHRGFVNFLRFRPSEQAAQASLSLWPKSN